MAKGGKVLRELLSGGAAQVGAAMVGFAMFPLLTRLLEKEQLGAWSLISSVAMFTGLANLGIEMAIQRAVVAEDPARARRSLGFALLMVTILGPLIAAVLVLTQLDFGELSEAVQREMHITTAVALVAGFVAAVNLPYQSFLYARGGYRFVAAAKATGSLIQLTSFLGFLLKTSTVVPAAALLLGAVTELWMTARAARHFDSEIPLGPRLPKDRQEALETIRDGLAQVSINFSVVTADRVDLFVLKWVTSTRLRKAGLDPRAVERGALAAVGFYSIGAGAVGAAYKLAKQANTVLIRRLGNPKERRQALFIGTAVFGGLITAGMSAVALDAQPFLVAVLGEKASHEIVSVVLLLLGSAAMVMSTYEVASSTVMLGSKTAWACALPVVAGALVNLVVSLTGGHFYGVWAVAGSTLIGNLVTWVLMWRNARRLLELSLAEAAVVLAPALSGAMIAGAFAFLLRGFAQSSVWASLGVCLLVTASGISVMAVVARAVHRKKRDLFASEDSQELPLE